VAILPRRIPAGITFDETATLTAYPTEAWSLSVVLRGAGSITINAQPGGAVTYNLKVPANETANWVPGRYWYSARVSDGENIVEVESGEVEVSPNLAAETEGFSGLTHAQRVLAAIEAVLEKRASRDQERYTINNRELWRTPIADLLTLRDRYRAQVRMEQKAKRGNLFGTAVRVRF
jgi:hypothetical protein